MRHSLPADHETVRRYLELCNQVPNSWITGEIGRKAAAEFDREKRQRFLIHFWNSNKGHQVAILEDANYKEMVIYKEVAESMGQKITIFIIDVPALSRLAQHFQPIIDLIYERAKFEEL